MLNKKHIVGVLAGLLLASFALPCNPVFASGEVDEIQEDVSAVTVEEVTEEPAETSEEGIPESSDTAGEEAEEDQNVRKINEIYIRCTLKLHGGEAAALPEINIESVGPQGVDSELIIDTKKSCWIDMSGNVYKKSAAIKAGKNTLSITLQSETTEFSPECEIVFNGEILEPGMLQIEGSTLTLKQVFNIPNRISVSKATVKLSKTSYVYNGKARKPSVTVKVKGKTLKRGKDFKVYWKNNKNAGKASCIIKGIGDYKDKKTVKFTIKKKSITPKVKLSVDWKYYTGAVRAPKITVSYKKKTLKKGRDYRIVKAPSSTSNGISVGKVIYVIKLKGNYTGKKRVEFLIRPKETAIVTAERVKTNLKLIWREQSEMVTGYEIQYSPSMLFWKSRTTTVNITNPKTTKLELKVKDKIYYARIRTYKIVGKQIYYSKWSMARKSKPPGS